MSEALFVSLALLVLLVILPAMLGLAFMGAGGNRRRAEALLCADNVRASSTLAYYNEVHDSHSG